MRPENLELENSLMSAWTLTELWTWNWRGCCHAVPSKFRVFDVTRVALLVKSRDSRSKNKQVAILEPFDESGM